MKVISHAQDNSNPPLRVAESQELQEAQTPNSCLIERGTNRDPCFTSLHDRNVGIPSQKKVRLRLNTLILYSHDPVLGILFLFQDVIFIFQRQPLPTTSPALEASLHPILKYIILPIQICQGFYCICISNLIKSFSGLTFFLEGNFKLNIFSLLSLSPFQSNFTFRLQITQYQEQGEDAVTIFPSLVCGKVQLCIAKPGLRLQKNLSQTP